jgi:hypothetical protein
MVYQEIKLRKWIPLSKLNWCGLSFNPNAIELLKNNQNKIYRYHLFLNINGIEILKDNPEKIDWNIISSNPSIFTYDYELIHERFKDLGEEIIKKALHPKRMLRLMNEYGEDEIYKCYFDEY